MDDELDPRPSIQGQDEDRLAELGYKQELTRNWSLIHNFGVSFSIIVSRWTGVPPIVLCRRLRRPRAEARKQLQTLESFKAYFIKHHRSSLVGLWEGKKVFHFEDPANYLKINHKAAPQSVFRPDLEIRLFCRGDESVNDRGTVPAVEIQLSMSFAWTGS